LLHRFGKRAQDNLRIIRELASLKSLSFPIMIGLSRKGFIGEILDRPVEKRLIGTVTANTRADGDTFLRVARTLRLSASVTTYPMARAGDAVRELRAGTSSGSLVLTVG